MVTVLRPIAQVLSGPARGPQGLIGGVLGGAEGLGSDQVDDWLKVLRTAQEEVGQARW